MPITAQQRVQILPNAGKQAGVFASMYARGSQRGRHSKRAFGISPRLFCR